MKAYSSTMSFFRNSANNLIVLVFEIDLSLKYIGFKFMHFQSFLRKQNNVSDKEAIIWLVAFATLISLNGKAEIILFLMIHVFNHSVYLQFFLRPS